MNRCDKYNRGDDGNCGVLSRGLPQMELKALMPGQCSQDGKGVWEPIPSNTAWDTSPYVRHQDESRPKVKVSRKDGRRMLIAAYSLKDKEK
jgi:hypothetical protein